MADLKQRSIEFRALDKRGKWHYGYLLTMHSPDRLFIMDEWHRIGGEATIKDELFASTVEIRSETVGQFTGLLDIHDQKIFDGDIVRWTRDSLCNGGESINHTEGIGRVAYVKEFAHFGILPLDPSELGHLGFDEEAKYEVVGNIFEQEGKA